MGAGIEQYPGLIAEIQYKINSNLEKCEGLKFRINEIVCTAEKQVVFDESLKNEQQRKVRTKEILSEDSDYVSMNAILTRYELQRKKLIIELEKLQNEFAILKLLKREKIAQMETCVY